MKPVNWLKIKHKWFHLSDIPFPQLAQRGTIDVLLGADNHELKEVPGDVNEPSARLCPLGWTAIGRIDKEDLGEGNHTGLIRTFRIQQSEETSASQDDDLNITLRKFWELGTLESYLLRSSSLQTSKQHGKRLANREPLTGNDTK